MATKFEPGMHEKTTRELERIRKDVLNAKQELHDRLEKYFRVLHDKQLEIETRLDEVVHVAEKQAMDKQTKLNQLTMAKAEVLQTLQHDELNETVNDVCQKFEEEIQKLEAIVDDVPSVWLEWRDEWLEGRMRKMCLVCEGLTYVRRQTPVWTGVSRGEGQKEISNSTGLVTDRDNGEVFVCDYLANLIQVFNKDGNYQRSFKQEGMFLPVNITITPHQLFVSCAGISYRILKLDKLSGNIMASVTPRDPISCITADTNTLYGGLFETNQIVHLSLEDMSTMKMTSLDSPHLQQDTKLCDLKVTPSLFVVLFLSSNSPIQTFSKEGNLVRTIASEELRRPVYLCLDRHYNILVSDSTAHNIKVFSSEGNLIAIIGHEGTGPGEFHRPQGIDVDKEGRIVIVDNKNTHMVQFF